MYVSVCYAYVYMRTEAAPCLLHLTMLISTWPTSASAHHHHDSYILLSGYGHTNLQACTCLHVSVHLCALRNHCTNRHPIVCTDALVLEYLCHVCKNMYLSVCACVYVCSFSICMHAFVVLVLAHDAMREGTPETSTGQHACNTHTTRMQHVSHPYAPGC